jgi:hypothetical protein
VNTELYLIAAVDENWAIGYNNELLFRIPADLRLNLKKKTLGQVVVLGRKTLESLPGQRPLPDRVNIVVSRSLATPVPVLYRNKIYLSWPLPESAKSEDAAKLSKITRYSPPAKISRHNHRSREIYRTAWTKDGSAVLRSTLEAAAEELAEVV